MIDFEYVTRANGFTYVHPVSEPSMSVWRDNPLLHAGLFPHEFEAFQQQARKAGYSVRKYKSVKISDDQLLSELESL